MLVYGVCVLVLMIWEKKMKDWGNVKGSKSY